MGAVLGRATFTQLLFMGLIEISLYSANLYLGTNVFRAVDAGGSVFVHAFGAYFGLAASLVMNRRARGSQAASPLQTACYTSDLLAMIGTLFLWIYWPSFNAIELEGHDQHRAVVNTYLSLAACCVTTFAVSLFLGPEHKLDMAHVQNATLAGGVAVGATCNLMLQPYGAILVGMLAGTISTFGFGKISPFLLNKLSLPDTCGVHNLHGLPGAFGGLVSVLMVGIASETTYGKAALYESYPARAPPRPSHDPKYRWVSSGLDRTAAEQPFLLNKLSLPDTCGVHNLHGLPGAFGGLVSVLMAGIASETTYGKAALYESYPARAPPRPSHDTEYRWVSPGLDRTAGEQAGFQAAALGVTMAVAVVGGLVTGYILRSPVMPAVQSEFQYDDAISWEIPESTDHEKKLSVASHTYENRSFQQLENGYRF